MLRDEVVQAVEDGQFHVWPIHTIEEGIHLLTDMEAGELQPDGTYPAGTFNHAITQKLGEFAKLAETLKDSNTKGNTANRSPGSS